MHRQILGLKRGDICDHKDGDGLNNTRKNLRKATHSQNGANRLRISGTSKYRGVHKETGRKNWRAALTHDGKTIRIGTFDSEIDAAHAYDRKAIELHKEFARLNFPET